ncbi:hypothetical protein CFP56_037900 [Quercus suber]|uniref:Uncharacterized protein n=1 Tax=Quercus suber TaxID=58331 RepID=A0AAW0J3V2_QUESU
MALNRLPRGNKCTAAKVSENTLSHVEFYDPRLYLLIKEDPGLTSLTNNAGESPLFLAVDRGFYKIAIHILEAVPKCSNVGRKSMNVLHAAVIRTQRSKYFNSRSTTYVAAINMLNNPPNKLPTISDHNPFPSNKTSELTRTKCERFASVNKGFQEAK